MANAWRKNPLIVASAEQVTFAHFRETRNNSTRLRATLAIIPVGDGSFVGATAIVNSNEQGSKKVGRDISLGRAMSQLAHLKALEDSGVSHFPNFLFDTADDARDFIIEAKRSDDIKSFIEFEFKAETEEDRSFNQTFETMMSYATEDA